MFKIEMADLLVQVNNRYDDIQQKCADYIVKTNDEPDLIMEASEADIRNSQKWKRTYANETVTEAEAETDSAPYNIYPELPRFDAVWLHAAVVEMGGGAYAFSAPSGYGKSTHVRLWLKAFGENVRIINGDNPIIRLEDGIFYAYGTPFCGKEGYQVNTRVPLKGICFLNHAEKNGIYRVMPAAAVMRLYRDNWTIKPETSDMHLGLYCRLVEHVPVYMLMCNQEVDAAHTAWAGMRDQ